MQPLKLIDMDYHRNGVSGVGFYVAIVKSEGEDMLVVRFPDCDKAAGGVVCAAFNIEKLAQRKIRFIENSYRGDCFHVFMDAKIKERDNVN